MKVKVNEPVKVLWASQHQIGSDQRSALMNIIESRKQKCVHIEERSIIWSSSISEERDNEQNIELWDDIAHDFDIVCGVFPPSAMTALNMARGIADEEGNEQFDELLVFTPIANISSIGGRKVFTFLRWQEV